MSKLRANIDNLQQAESKLSSAHSDLDKLKGDLKEVLKTVSANWEGTAAEEYKNKLRQYIKEIDSMIASVDELNDYARDTSNGLQARDFIRNIVNFLIPFSDPF